MENMEVNPEAEQASKKPSKMKAIFAALFAVVLVLGGVYYFVFGQQDGSTPPSLSPEEPSLYQGFIGEFDEGKKFLEIEESDITAWADKANEVGFGNLKDLDMEDENEGLYFLSSVKELSFEDVLGSVEALKDVQYFTAGYDMGYIFNTTPNEYYDKDVIKEIELDKLKDVKFAAGEGIIFGSTAGKLKYDGTVLVNSDEKLILEKDYCGDLKEEEWNLVRVSSDMDSGVTSKDFVREFDECMDSVEAVWPLNPTLEEFTNADEELETKLQYFPAEAPLDGIIDGSYEIADHTDHYIAWVKFGEVAEETPPPAAAVGCEKDQYAKSDNAEDFIEDMRNAVTDIDFAAAYCLLDNETQKEIDSVLAVVMNTSNDLSIDDIADSLAQLAPKFEAIVNDDNLLGTFLQFIEVGDADVLVNAVRTSGADETFLTILSLAKNVLPTVTDLVSADDSVNFLEELTLIVSQVRDGMASSNDVNVQKILAIIEEALVIIENAELNVDVSTGSQIVTNVLGAVVSELDKEGKVRVEIEVLPVAGFDFTTKTDKDGNVTQEAVAPFYFETNIVKDEAGKLKLNFDVLSEHVFIMKETDENGDEKEIELTGLSEAADYFRGKLKEFANEEGLKFAALSGFLTDASSFVDDFIASGDPVFIFDGLERYIEFADEVGGDVSIEKAVKTADENGLVIFNSNIYSQWLGLVHGQAAVVKNVVAGANIGDIVYVLDAGTTGVTDYAAYIVPKAETAETGAVRGEVDFGSLLSGSGFTVKMYTIDGVGMPSDYSADNFIFFRDEGVLDKIMRGEITWGQVSNETGIDQQVSGDIDSVKAAAETSFTDYSTAYASNETIKTDIDTLVAFAQNELDNAQQSSPTTGAASATEAEMVILQDSYNYMVAQRDLFMVEYGMVKDVYNASSDAINAAAKSVETGDVNAAIADYNIVIGYEDTFDSAMTNIGVVLDELGLNAEAAVEASDTRVNAL